MTREQLERSLNAFAPGTQPGDRGRTAVQYVRSLAFSSLAEQQGLDKNPELAKEIEAQMKVARMRILANVYLQNLQRQRMIVTPEEVQKYYDEHHQDYEQAELRRLAVPISAPSPSGKPLDRAAVRSELEELRKRAVAGEDLNVLQQDAYKDLQIQAAPPPVNALTVRRINLQGEEAKAFDLNAGDVSAVIDAPAAVVIIKLGQKELLPVGSVRQEIQTALTGERMQTALSKLSGTINAKFDLDYLGLSSQPDLFAITSLGPAPGHVTRRLPGSRRSARLGPR
jgi:hypothetical protein